MRCCLNVKFRCCRLHVFAFNTWKNEPICLKIVRKPLARECKTAWNFVGNNSLKWMLHHSTIWAKFDISQNDRIYIHACGSSLIVFTPVTIGTSRGALWLFAQDHIHWSDFLEWDEPKPSLRSSQIKRQQIFVDLLDDVMGNRNFFRP